MSDLTILPIRKPLMRRQAPDFDEYPHFYDLRDWVLDLPDDLAFNVLIGLDTSVKNYFKTNPRRKINYEELKKFYDTGLYGGRKLKKSKSKRTKSKRSKSKRTKSKRTKSKKSKSKKSKSKKSKSKRTKSKKSKK